MLPPRLQKIFVYLGTNILGHGVSFVLLPIVTRYLPPSLYGRYALAMTVSALVGVLGSSWLANVGFRLYYEARQEERTRSYYFSLAAVQAVVFATLYTSVAFILTWTRPGFLSIGTLAAAGFAVLATDMFAQALRVLRAEDMTRRFVACNAVGAVLRLAVTVGGLELGFRNPAMVFVGVAVSQAAAAGIAIWGLNQRLLGGLTFDARAMGRLFVLGPRAIPFSLGVWTGRLSDRLILNHYTASSVVGIYAAGYALADRTVGALVQALFMMAWPDILRSWSENGAAAAKRAISDATSMYLWLTVGPALFLILFHQPFIGVFLSEDYHDAAKVIPAIVIASWVSGMVTYLNRQFELHNRFGTISSITMVGSLLNVVLNFILVPRLGAQGSALAAVGNYVAVAIIFAYLRDRELVEFPLRDFVEVAGTCLLAWIGSALVGGTYVSAGVFVLVYTIGALALVRRKNWFAAP